MLRRLNEATNARGMNLPGWGLHPLKGRELKGHFSVWVHGNWRITFTRSPGKMKRPNTGCIKAAPGAPRVLNS